MHHKMVANGTLSPSAHVHWKRVAVSSGAIGFTAGPSGAIHSPNIDSVNKAASRLLSITPCLLLGTFLWSKIQRQQISAHWKIGKKHMASPPGLCHCTLLPIAVPQGLGSHSLDTPGYPHPSSALAVPRCCPHAWHWAPWGCGAFSSKAIVTPLQ